MPQALPLAPRPQAGELLVSWFGRLAAANGIEVHDLFLRMPHSRNVAAPIAVHIAKLARVSVETVTGLELPATGIAAKWWNQGMLHHGHAEWPWSLNTVFAWCPACFQERIETGQPAYIRRSWALSIATFCEAHGTPLINACHNCGVYRQVIYAPLEFTARPICGSCGVSMAGPPAPPLNHRIDKLLVLLENDVRVALTPGCNAGFIDGYNARLFLKVVTDLIAILGRRELGTDWRPVNACAPLIYQQYPLSKDDCLFNELGLQRRRAILAAMVDMHVGTPQSRQAAFAYLYGACHDDARIEARQRFRTWPEPIRTIALRGFKSPFEAPAKRTALSGKLRRWRQMLPSHQRRNLGTWSCCATRNYNI